MDAEPACVPSRRSSRIDNACTGSPPSVRHTRADAFCREQLAWVLGNATLESDAAVDGLAEALAGAPPPSPRGFSAQADACIPHDARDRAGRIRASALVLAGADDALVPRSATEALSKLLPRARFEVHPGGPAFLLESAEEVAASVLRFLRSIEEGDGGG